MALASLGGGQQTDNGLTNDPRLQTQGDITLYTTTATITAAELVTGILSYTGAGHTLTLPTAALLDATFTAAKQNSSYDFTLIATTGTATLAVGTGITNVGALTVAASTATRFRLRKTNAPGATSAWVVYRLA